MVHCWWWLGHQGAFPPLIWNIYVLLKPKEELKYVPLIYLYIIDMSVRHIFNSMLMQSHGAEFLPLLPTLSKVLNTGSFKDAVQGAE